MTTPGWDETWLDDIFDAVVSDIQTSGFFRKVNTHEPKRPPEGGLTAAVWCSTIDPVPRISGLSMTSARIEFIARIYSNMLKEPQDEIDPAVMKAASAIIRRYHDDFDFDGAIRNVDVLGIAGQPLRAYTGYLEISNTYWRVCDIAIPCLVNDVWEQNP